MFVTALKLQVHTNIRGQTVTIRAMAVGGLSTHFSNGAP